MDGINSPQPNRLKGEISTSEDLLKYDIWSLGLVLVELTTGRYPSTMDDKATIFQELSAIVPDVAPNVPQSFTANLRDFCDRCLNKIGSARPSLQELLSHPLVICYNEDNTAIEAMDFIKAITMMVDKGSKKFRPSPTAASAKSEQLLNDPTKWFRADTEGMYIEITNELDGALQLAWGRIKKTLIQAGISSLGSVVKERIFRMSSTMLGLISLLQFWNPQEDMGKIIEQVAMKHRISTNLKTQETFETQLNESFRFISTINSKYPMITQQLEVGHYWKDFFLKML